MEYIWKLNDSPPLFFSFFLSSQPWMGERAGVFFFFFFLFSGGDNVGVRVGDGQGEGLEGERERDCRSGLAARRPPSPDKTARHSRHNPLFAVQTSITGCWSNTWAPGI
jgi:hypothetical protein